MTRKYFGTDGVRGPYGGTVINEAFAARLGVATARWLKARIGAASSEPAIVLIGRDPRFSGEALERALSGGFRSEGCVPISLGVLPTPAVARAVVHFKAAMGAMVTASHNPALDNGIKFFDASGRKLNDEQEAVIEAALPDDVPIGVNEFVRRWPQLARIRSDGVSDYVDGMSRLLPPNCLAGWTIVLDTANGATCTTSLPVLAKLGPRLISIGDHPDGRNINAGVGSEHPGPMAARVKESGARLGIAHDGDGDRCVLCDEKGEILDGDEILTILALGAMEENRLANRTLVITVQSNLGVDAAVAAAGGRTVRTAVGDRYVIERMLAEGANLGGESSGHILLPAISPTGDGLAAALMIIQAMVKTGQPLSELRRRLTKAPQATSAIVVGRKLPLEQLPRLGAAIAALEKELGERGRVLVRYSGTEAKLRFLVEGPDTAAVTGGLARLESAARADFS
ncbi:MAG TPA: phosphoglucosamine mutase [Opitutaceae bacterium]